MVWFFSRNHYTTARSVWGFLLAVISNFYRTALLPQWFGVTADGTDQSAALQKCIDSANGAVYFPPGNYACKNISLAANTTYFGAGRASKISLFQGNLYDAFRLGPNKSNVTIEHLFFYGDNLRNASYSVGGRGIRIYTDSVGQSNSNITVNNCEFSDFGFGAIRVWTNTSKVWITNNYIHRIRGSILGLYGQIYCSP